MNVKKCELCGKRAARYVCQECGREVCETCLEPNSWMCLDCYRRINPALPRMETKLSIPIKLFILGFLLIFIGIILTVLTPILLGISEVGAGTIIWIFPFPPIILGAGPLDIGIITLIFLALIGLVLALIIWKLVLR